ncbi:MAG: bifunctional glutamate N-acetyltransferase/amino-acid acetyltransferase ArgJ [Ascidiaceihabitans sp.]|jgi:glutamate N-acetyltransferase/amino-acid N-acetyltransferase|nr:bifunctional glutamate N-acetyltransferase/amino-acid acetyltransferase ArgJ [Ascidiaceihabitans sp.]
MASTMQKSPLAPAHFPDLPVVDGVTFATIAAGVRYSGRTDVMLAKLIAGTSIAGVFTKSTTRAAPVLDCQTKLGGDCTESAAILVNSGNANAFTGKNGQTSVTAICDAVADACDVPVNRVFTSSTGVIGEPLAHDRIIKNLQTLNSTQNADDVEAAAHAIMTTDTYAKGSAQTVQISGQSVQIVGIAKGSGMIAPDMATMLVYIFTDAVFDQVALQQLVSDTSDRTFNCITVDSDTSTSDSLLMAATGASGVNAQDNADFATALHKLMLDLSQQVVRDGEGATKLVKITVTGGIDDSVARIHAMAIANSPLVKTAIAGEDPNWGRIVMAIGKSGAPADRDLISISFGDVNVATQGWVNPNYVEADAAALMKKQEIDITVDLGMGTGTGTVWTCDLTHGYIEINADYRS